MGMLTNKKKFSFNSNQKGFTYLDVIVAFAIFGLVLVVVLRVGQSVHKLNRIVELETQMAQLASLEFENYKNGIEDIPSFISDTGFSVVTQTLNGDGHAINRVLVNGQVDQHYNVLITETYVNVNTSQVTIEITCSFDDVEPVKLSGYIIKNTY